MKETVKKHKSEIIVPVIMVGAIWGIFEATVGYLLHLLPVSIGFLVWYPVAVYFLMTAYRITKQKKAVVATAALAAFVKLFNLFLPGSIDRVLNPGFSILFQGLAVCCAIYFFEHVKWAKKTQGMLLLSIGMNTLWRAMYMGYLAFFVPDWIREVSILQNSSKLFRFIVIDNLCSSLIVFAGILIAAHLIHRPTKSPRMYPKVTGFARVMVPALLLILNIALQMTL